MSDKAKGLLRQAIQEYESGDGASRLGSYRDAITDLLHQAAADIEIEAPRENIEEFHHWIISTLYQMVVTEGYDMFMEERKDTEALLIDQTPAKELPTLIGRKWEFEENLERLTIRLKKGK